MNLLVTGGAGFIGSNVIRHIIDRPGINRLINLDCLTYAGHLANVEDVLGHPKYVFEQVDLRDKSTVVRVVGQHAITHVLHLAAESHVDRSITGPDDFIHTNIVGTFHLLEACRAHWLDSQFSILNRPRSSFTSPPTKSMAASVPQARSARQAPTPPTLPIPPAKLPATCSYARTTAPTAFLR